MRTFLVMLCIFLSVPIVMGYDGGNRPPPGTFPDSSNPNLWDKDGVPRYGKYVNDWIDIGAYEYVPVELKDENGRYITGSYIDEEGNVIMPDGVTVPMAPDGLKLLQERGS